MPEKTRISFDNIAVDAKTVIAALFIVGGSVAGFWLTLRTTVNELDERWQERVATMATDFKTDIGEIKLKIDSDIALRLRQNESSSADIKARLSIIEDHKILPEARERISNLELEMRELKEILKKRN